MLDSTEYVDEVISPVLKEPVTGVTGLSWFGQ
jgi:hypothetical protein